MAAAKKSPHAEFAKAMGTDLRHTLQGRPGCAKAVAALARLRGNGRDMGELVDELRAIAPELRAAIEDAKVHDPELARGLSKLADVPACADFLTPEEMLGKLEFLRERL